MEHEKKKKIRKLKTEMLTCRSITPNVLTVDHPPAFIFYFSASRGIQKASENNTKLTLNKFPVILKYFAEVLPQNAVEKNGAFGSQITFYKN